ncbi:unnamed protein product [Absidia cylindrospora]
MTKDDPVEHLFPELTCDNTQEQRQQQKPFQVVLVNLEVAANGSIRCVEEPLTDDSEELSFIALSYRWGELQERLVDTECGYIASVTSFSLFDFYDVCKMILNDPNLKSIKYVWVDAICIDQTNYERRKATIHQMSSIYEKATFILAVPDLHKQHLINISAANEAILGDLWDHRHYIHHLIQGNTDKLAQLDNEFLDKTKMPNDPMLRQLVMKHTDCFMDGFTNTCRPFDFDAEVVLEDLYDISLAASLTNHRRLASAQTDRYASLEKFCTDYDSGRIDESFMSAWCRERKGGVPELPWKMDIIRRSKSIQQVMKFLKDLIRDWSSRV